jgi:hypothetical protein
MILKEFPTYSMNTLPRFSPLHESAYNSHEIELSERRQGLVPFHSISIHPDDVSKIIKALPAKTSIDNDGLSYKVLKEGGIILATQLSQLFSFSLNVRRIPTSWKISNVTPIHKGGSRQVVSNYRPISVTSCCCRILERFIRKNLSEYLSIHHIITDTQHGFVPRKSTETILLNFYDYVTDKVDNNMVVDAIFFDLSKAFDTIPHAMLVTRLYYYGISGKALRWIKDFLTNRQQMVCIGNESSKLLPVTSGVIQGSVLGPTLFNIFINNVDASVRHCMILKYADDIRLFSCSSKSVSALATLSLNLQYDIDRITEWTSNCGMALNVSKCFYATFGTSFTSRSYSIGSSPITAKTPFQDLGITVSSPLSFNKHIDIIVAKAYSRLGLIHKAFHTKSRKSILRLFKAYVRPILEYSSIVWNPYTNRCTDKIERVHRHMCRMIPSIRHLSYRDQLNCLGLYSLQLRRQRYQLISMFKFYHQLTDVDFDLFFTVKTDNRTRGHKLSIIPKFAKYNYRLNFFTNSSVHLWNQLTDEDIDAPTLAQFKKRLDNFFRKHDFW